MGKKRVGMPDTLLRAIAESGLSLYAISKRSGVAAPIIQRFVRRERDIRLETAEKIAEVLGLELTKRK
jgi:hypothetical protein